MSKAIIITSREYYKLFNERTLSEIDIPETRHYFSETLCAGFQDEGGSEWDKLCSIFSMDPKATEANYQQFWSAADHSEETLKMLVKEIGETVVFIMPCMPVYYDSDNIMLRHQYLFCLIQDARAYGSFAELYLVAHGQDLFSASLDRIFKDTDLIGSNDPLSGFSKRIYGFKHTQESKIFPYIEKGSSLSDDDISEILSVYPSETRLSSSLKKLDDYPFTNNPKPTYDGLMGIVNELSSVNESKNV